MLNYAQILWERVPHTTGSNHVTLLQLSMGSTFWKTCMNNSMKTLHFTFAGLILNSDLLFVVWKRLMKTKMTFRCQTCWIHFRNALWTHEGLLRRCLRMKRPIFKEKKLTRKKNEKLFSELMIDDSNLKSCVKNAKHFKVFVHWNSSEQLSSSVVKNNFSVKIFNFFAESECCFFLLINFHSLNRSRQKSKFISNLKPRKRSVFVFRLH